MVQRPSAADEHEIEAGEVPGRRRGDGQDRGLPFRPRHYLREVEFGVGADGMPVGGRRAEPGLGQGDENIEGRPDIMWGVNVGDAAQETRAAQPALVYGGPDGLTQGGNIGLGNQRKESPTVGLVGTLA